MEVNRICGYSPRTDFLHSSNTTVIGGGILSHLPRRNRHEPLNVTLYSTTHNQQAGIPHFPSPELGSR
jgi:hypothetical protein